MNFLHSFFITRKICCHLCLCPIHIPVICIWYIFPCVHVHMCKHNTHWQKLFHCCLIWILTFLNMKVIINSQISTCKSPYYIITLKTHWLLLVNHHTNFCITIFTRPLEEIVTQSKLKDLFLDHISLTA